MVGRITRTSVTVAANVAASERSTGTFMSRSTKGIDFTPISLTRRPSDLLPHSGSLLQQFHVLVGSHDVHLVSKFLDEHGSEVDLNGQNWEGHTALHLAVIGDDQPMVERLLEIRPRLALGNSLLHAVQTGNLMILEQMLAHRKAIETDSEIQVWIPDCADFTSDITPLILAAHQDNFTLVKILLENGHTVSKPHPVGCQCSENCRFFLRVNETLSQSLARINIYKAIASPSYILLTSEDPILEAFELNLDLLMYAESEPEFRNDYVRLASQCSDLAVDMLGLCRTTDEVLTMLNWKSRSETSDYQREKFTRVVQAVEFNLKDFVTHPNCQQVLCNEWLQDFAAFRSVRFLGMCYLILQRMILFPFIAILCWTLPWTRLAKSYQTPINKYLSGAASYFVFLGLLLAQNFLKTGKEKRGPPETGLEYIIIIFVVAMWMKNLLYLWRYGQKRYMQLTWNLYDCIMLLLFSATFICWGLASYQVATKPGSRNWPRPLWSPTDPCLIAELFFGISVLTAFFKILFFFQFNSSIGMLMVSMVRMVADTASFLAILLIIIASFSVGLYNIYQPYKDYTRRKDDEVIRQNKAFTTILTALANLYWGFFGYTGPEFAKVVLPEHKVMIGNQTIYVYNEHGLTEAVGTLFLAAFYLFCVVVMMNMLVAMLTNALTSVLLNADTEWKFNRTKIWLSFFTSGDSLPPPFNLLPHPASIFRLIKWIFVRIKQNMEVKEKTTQDQGKTEGLLKPKAKKNRAVYSCIRCCYFDEDESDVITEADAYQALMTKLIQRYLTSQRSDEKDKDHPTTSFVAIVSRDLRELTTEVKNLKQELTSSASV